MTHDDACTLHKMLNASDVPFIYVHGLPARLLRPTYGLFLPFLLMFVFDVFVGATCCVCVCVFSSHLNYSGHQVRWAYQPGSHRRKVGFLIHLPSAVRALIFLARRIQPFLSLVDCEVEFTC